MPGHLLPHRVQWMIVAAVAAAIGAGILYGAVWALYPATAQPEPDAAAPGRKSRMPGAFKPTPEEWAGLKIERVATRAFRPEVVTEGNIALDDDLNTPVFSPYSGRVVRIIARLGDHVARGAPLFAIEASEFVQTANTLITAVAAARTAHSQLAQAQINEQRAHDLYLAKGGALKDWQQSRTDLATAQNSSRSADIALAAARNQLRILGKSEAEIAALEAQPTQRLDPVAIVAAPIAGTVTQRQVGLGQYIQSVSSGAAAPVYTIGDLSVVWLIADVREADMPQIRVGEPVEVHVLAYPGRVFTARIAWVAPAIDANTHRLPVRAEVENSQGALKPAMFASFTIVTGPAVVAPAVPPSAIVYEGEEARLWVAGTDDTLALRQVRTGRTSGGGKVEILSGLSPGERVVTRGTVFIDRAGGTD